MKKTRDRKTAAQTAADPHGDDMPSEIDFSGGTRGRFYRPNAQLHLPVYMDADTQAYLSTIAARKGVPLSDLVNELLRREIAILEAVK